MKRLRSLHRRDERRPAALGVSFVVHALAFVLVFMLGREVAQVAVEKKVVLTYRAPPPPPPPPPPKGGRKREKIEKKIELKKPELREVIIPVEMPKELPTEPEPVEEVSEVDEEDGVEGGVEGGVVGGVVGGVIGGVLGGEIGGQLGGELDTSGEAMEITVGVTQPRLVKKAPPEFPAAALRRKVFGEVVLRCIVDEEGHVEVKEVVQAPELLEDAAIHAVERWRYEPAIYKGHPQAVFLIVRLNFTPPKK